MRGRFLFLALSIVLAAPLARAVPYVPADDSVVLERLPGARDPQFAALKKLRAEQRARPGDLGAATSFAQRAIDAMRATGDPRWLGQAQAALAPWWNAPDAPSTVLAQRAKIKELQHEFAGAIADLEALLAREPGNGQAQINRATVLFVVGRHAEALAACAAIASRVTPLVAAACNANPASVSGNAAQAAQALDAALAAEPTASPSVRAWALTFAAEIAARRNDAVTAERHFRAALDSEPGDQYLLGAYADFLLDRDRPAEVVPLLREWTRNDGLLLRLTLAESRLPEAKASFEAHRAELAARVGASRLRGDTTHSREEARFSLAFERDPARAVALAKLNFGVQREPADVRILVEAAKAANDTAALKIATDWIATTKLEDAEIAKLIGKRS